MAECGILRAFECHSGHLGSSRVSGGPRWRILRDKLPRRLTVTKQERNRLIKLGKGLSSALKDPPSVTFSKGEVVCRERLGGLLKHYSRAAT